MIISASRRTDLPAFYSEWFFQRLKEGYVLVRNPFSAHQVSRITLHPDVVDGIVFWSKNPAPMMKRLNECREYPFYFQFTLNAYGKKGRGAGASVPGRENSYVSVSVGTDRTGTCPLAILDQGAAVGNSRISCRDGRCFWDSAGHLRGTGRFFLPWFFFQTILSPFCQFRKDRQQCFTFFGQ